MGEEEIIRAISSFACSVFRSRTRRALALLAYASSYLKAHHPAVFCAALLNAQPMGFYRPATLVKDVQRHGVRVRLPKRDLDTLAESGALNSLDEKMHRREALWQVEKAWRPRGPLLDELEDEPEASPLIL